MDHVEIATVERDPINPGPPKNQIVNAGSKYVNSKKKPGSDSRCRILKASLTSASKAVSDVSNSTRL